MWEEIVKGGIMMIPLFICSLLALTITIERAFSLRRNKVLNQEIIDSIQNFKKAEDEGLIRSVCQKHKNSFSSIISYGIENLDLSKDELKEGIREKGKQEVRNLERGLDILETIAGIAEQSVLNLQNRVNKLQHQNSELLNKIAEMSFEAKPDQVSQNQHKVIQELEENEAKMLAEMTEYMNENGKLKEELIAKTYELKMSQELCQILNDVDNYLSGMLKITGHHRGARHSILPSIKYWLNSTRIYVMIWRRKLQDIMLVRKN